jgi:hypothetical protein
MTLHGKALNTLQVSKFSRNKVVPVLTLYCIGYVQNPHVSNFSAEQRRAQDVQDSGNLGSYGHDKPSTTAAFGVDPEGVWNTAKAWASTAGKKLSEVESEVWKRVNGEK